MCLVWLLQSILSGDVKYYFANFVRKDTIFIVILTCFLVRPCKYICARKGFGSHVFLVAYLVMSGHAIVFLRQEGNPDKDQGMVCMMNVQRLEYKTLEQGRP